MQNAVCMHGVRVEMLNKDKMPSRIQTNLCTHSKIVTKNVA